jgi:ferredoxin--NADP+ reductase
MDVDPTNATLIARDDVTDVLSIVRVRPDSGTVPPFVPGQFIRLGLLRAPRPEEAGRPVSPRRRIRLTRRAYSMTSPPSSTEWMEFFVVRIERGELTPRLWTLETGGRLWMAEEAKGEFRIDLAPPDKDLVMVSTGTGIAPYISMLRAYRGQHRWRRLVLINGVRRVADLGFRAELEATAREDSSVIYIPVVGRNAEQADFHGLRGRVQDALEPQRYEVLVGAPLDPQRCNVFLCGNPAMIDSVASLLETRGFTVDSRETRGNLHFERYW